MKIFIHEVIVPVDSCAQEWELFNGFEYIVDSSSLITWHEARDICQQNFGELVSILDDDEKDFVAGLVSSGCHELNIF